MFKVFDYILNNENDLPELNFNLESELLEKYRE